MNNSKSVHAPSQMLRRVLTALLALTIAFAFSGISLARSAFADEPGDQTKNEITYHIKYVYAAGNETNNEIADEETKTTNVLGDTATVYVDTVTKDILGYKISEVKVQEGGSPTTPPNETPITGDEFTVRNGAIVLVIYEKDENPETMHELSVQIQYYYGETLEQAKAKTVPDEEYPPSPINDSAWIGDPVTITVAPNITDQFPGYVYKETVGDTTQTLVVGAPSTTRYVKVYYAKMDAPTTYTVAFNSSGGSAIASQAVIAGDKVTKPVNPSKSGYTFTGWTLNGAAYDFNVPVTGNITLIASWKAEPKPTMHNVSYTVNYVGLASAQTPYTRTVSVATDITTIAVQASDISKSFSGYRIASVKLANGTAVAAGSKVPNGSVITVTYEKVQKPGSWVSSGSRWWYRYTDGTYPTNEWIKVGGKSYHFDAAGWMQTGWLQLGSTWYFLNDSGAMTTGWQYVGGAWYFMDSDGKMRTGWIDDKGSRYYLSGTGAMVTGWKFLDNVWYYFNGSGAMTKGWQHVGGAWYHLGTDGKMLTGWKQDGSAKYYLSGSGAMITGWKYLDNAWYYFNGSGAMTKGWQYVGGAWYHMASNGKMQTGWYESNGIKYYISNSGAMVTGWRTIDGVWYYFKASGAMVKNAWVGNYWLGSDGKMAKDTWVDNDTYYVDANGAWVKGKRR